VEQENILCFGKRKFNSCGGFSRIDDQHQGVPLRTNAIVPHQNQMQEVVPHQARGLVKFDQHIKFVPHEVEFEDINAGWRIKGICNVPKEIEVDLNIEDDWSKVSGSRKGMASRQSSGRQTEEHAGNLNESTMGPISNYYEILQHDETNDKDGEEDEENQESEEVSSSFNPTYSDVNNWEYTTSSHGSEGSVYEDDDAFFEQLAEMTRALNVEPPNYGRTDSQDDNRERVASESNAGPRKSGCVTRVPKRLIEEISSLSKSREEVGWKEFMGDI
jgi:hypothetical protein